MKAKLLFVDGTSHNFEDVEKYEVTNFFLKLKFLDNHEHNIALGFIREMVWNERGEKENG